MKILLLNDVIEEEILNWNLIYLKFKIRELRCLRFFLFYVIREIYYIETGIGIRLNLGEIIRI